jgi:hypothetical protein
MVGLLLMEANLYLSAFIERLQFLVVLESLGLGVHLLGYMMTIIMFTIMFVVWRMTRAPLSR